MKVYVLASASKRRHATCIPAAIVAAAPLAVEMIRVAFVILQVESEILRPEYKPTVKALKSAGRSCATFVLGDDRTFSVMYALQDLF